MLMTRGRCTSAYTLLCFQLLSGTAAAATDALAWSIFLGSEFEQLKLHCIHLRPGLMICCSDGCMSVTKVSLMHAGDCKCVLAVLISTAAAMCRHYPAGARQLSTGMQAMPGTSTQLSS